MSIVMNMSNYEIESDSMNPKYGEESMFAEWSSTAALACQQQFAVSVNRQKPVLASLATVDINSLMKKMSVYRR